MYMIQIDYFQELQSKLRKNEQTLEQFRASHIKYIPKSQMMMQTKKDEVVRNHSIFGSLFNIFSTTKQEKNQQTPTKPQQNKKHIFPQKFSILDQIPNVYVWGSPGSGKTFIMDLFYQNLKFPKIERYHYNEFMLMVQNQIHQLQLSGRYSRKLSDEPVEEVGTNIAKRINLLCLDEFQVLDIADAMILKGLFETLWNFRVVTILTSNRPPDDLYLNGLQRHVFMPFIPFLKKQSDVLNLDGQIDYRTVKTQVLQTFYYPISDQTTKDMKLAFKTMIQGHKPYKQVIQVMHGRVLIAQKSYKGVAQFQFDQLCSSFDNPRGATDYIALSKSFHTVFIKNVPGFTMHNRNPLRRFILLIEQLYNASVKVYIQSEKPILQMLDAPKDSGYDEVFAFERCQSRLMEMSSKQYLKKQWAFE